MSKKATPNQLNAIPATSIILSGISFFADILALANVAYKIIVRDQLDNLALQLIAVVLVFLLGVGLGSLGLQGYNKEAVEKVLQIYVWAYLILACLSYVGVVFTFRRPFTLATYTAYVIIISMQLGAFVTLRNASLVKPVVSHALALMTVSVLHALTFLYYFVFVEIPPLIYVIGEWAFWIAWTLFAVPLIRSALRNAGFGTRLRRDS